MSVTDIIPDIHGQAEKLRLALQNLGWRRNGTTWLHPEPDRQIVFLGDFIDRGPESAQAIMGNHELNALLFHTADPETGAPLRLHDVGNCDQHKNFLNEFPLGASHTKNVLDWMKGLPLATAIAPADDNSTCGVCQCQFYLG